MSNVNAREAINVNKNTVKRPATNSKTSDQGMSATKTGGFAFSIPGGLGKPHYTRFRDLRRKFDLKDREMIEVLIELALRDGNLSTARHN